MPRLSATSAARLDSCHPFLVTIGLRVIERMDYAVLEGARSPAEQDAHRAAGRSTLRGNDPAAKHVVGAYRAKSDAVDVCPWPMAWPGELVPQILDAARPMRERRAALVEHGKRWARFARLAGAWQVVARQVAAERPEWAGWTLRWGGDWDGDHDLLDQVFDDLPHLEIMRTA